MSRNPGLTIRRTGGFAAIGALLACAIAAAQPQFAVAAEGDVIGRISFEDADLPPANVEIELTQGMFNDLFGIGDAAVAGIAETLSKSGESADGGEGVKVAAEQLEAARQILQLASEVVREVRVRGYEGAPEGVAAHFDGKLKGDWETLIRARKDEDNIRVSLLRNEGAIRGIFVVAANNEGLIIANVVCDVSPENAKKLTSAATKIGLENGLAQELEAKMQRMRPRLAPPQSGPPVEPNGSTR
jgi:hypothetical protein